MSIVLKAENIRKKFYQPAEFEVLKGLNFEVNTGEFFSIVGKSGCGKSTLLYILSTMDTDYEGTLTIKGDKLTGQKQNALSAFRNEHLGSIVGEIPFQEVWPELWVRNDLDYDRALQLLDRATLEAESPGTPWRCPSCGTEVEGQFAACWNCGRAPPRSKHSRAARWPCPMRAALTTPVSCRITAIRSRSRPRASPSRFRLGSRAPISARPSCFHVSGAARVTCRAQASV